MNKNIINQLSLIQELVSMKFDFSNPEFEEESKEYWACRFTINEKIVLYRKAKITPTKVGQFVTLWKRVFNGPIAPFHVDDDFDLVIISTVKENEIGQFVFPKSVLVSKGIVSTKVKEGKRGFRVYPPWDEALNKQAIRTQKWQLNYFLKITDGTIDVAKAQELFMLNEN
ncbi:MepB family protein [Aureibaculum sp. A20]|uniref:MepB family protein n=1 Tax=Aureibaculum flavum TaxID=2795986 RepID=A0ABS0WNC2_9FLAO|nr:MepB family protein [Aureibaculum flavum]MBJ2173442.1 MepB family protein [Aureibaculum flavum]